MVLTPPLPHHRLVEDHFDIVFPPQMREFLTMFKLEGGSWYEWHNIGSKGDRIEARASSGPILLLL